MSTRVVCAGDEVPPFTVALTLQRLVMEAAANRDFAPIHFDAEAARDSGAPTVYTNSTFIETLLEAALRRWAGLDAWIRMVEFKMSRFTTIGGDVSAAGVVTAAHADGDGVLAELDVWVDAPAGRSVSGRAVVSLSGARTG